MAKWLFKFDRQANKYNFEKVLYSLSVWFAIGLFLGLLIYIDYASRL